MTVNQSGFLGPQDKSAGVWLLKLGNGIATNATISNLGRVQLGEFSSDARRIATANKDGTVWLWNATDGSLVSPPMMHSREIAALAFNPDSSLLVTVGGGASKNEWETKLGSDSTVRIWDTSTGQPLTSTLHHSANVLAAAFNDDGTQLFTVTVDGNLLAWDLKAMKPRFSWPRAGESFPVAVSPDSRLLASCDQKFRVGIWSLETGDMLMRDLKLHSLPVTLRFTPDARQLCVTDGNYAHVWDAATGKRHTPDLPKSLPDMGWASVHLSLDGKLALKLDETGTNLHVQNAHTGSRIVLLQSKAEILQAAFSPDAKLIVARLEDDTVLTWNLPATQAVTWPSESKGVNPHKDIHRSPDGRWRFWSRAEGIDIWDNKTRERSFIRSMGSRGYAFAAANSILNYDGRLVLSVEGNEASLWSTIDGSKIALGRFKHRGFINAGAFSPDSQFVATGGADKTVNFWNATTGERIAEWHQPSPVNGVHFSPDGRGITVWDEHAVRFWQLPKGKRPVADWLALARFFARGRGTGLSGAGGMLRSSGTQSLRDEWLALRAKHPEVFTVSADEIDAWHRHEAWRCESTKDWSNAVTHLSALLETHPDSGDFLPRRAAAYVAMANELVASGVSRITSSADATQPVDQSRLTSAATNYLERALADLNRTIAWVDRYPAIAKESRLPFVERRRDVYLKLGRAAEAAADERELKGAGR